MYQDDCRLKGVVNLVLRDKNGKVKQHKTVRNKVTRYGIAHIIGRMVDDSQDKDGGHKMPRMMSHMGIGIGAAARGGPNRYNATNYNDPTAQTGSPKPRKHAAEPKLYDRMLQDERGIRVQLMKDTTKASDYEILRNQTFAKDSGSSLNIITTDGSVSKLTIQTGSGSGNTVPRLRVGLRLLGIRIAANSSSTADSTYTGGAAISTVIKIASITSGSPNSTATTIMLDGTIPNSDFDPSGANAGDANLFLDFEYVDRKPLTPYAGENDAGLNLSTNYSGGLLSSGTKMHPTHEAVTAMSKSTIAGGITNAGAHPFGPFNGAGVEHNEDGLANLGVLRGRIGAFYEREVDTAVTLVNIAGTGNTGQTDHGYAKLDGSGPNAVARFPFIGTEDNKPAGSAATSGVKATEFVQFGTAVDGIFQGEIPASGSSLVQDVGTAQEGYPANEHNYGHTASGVGVGGLTITGTGAAAVGSFPTATTNGLQNHALKYNGGGGSYAPNAVRGGKKHGDRVIYVATFKENNPRPEADRDFFNDGQGQDNGANRAPIDRIYPITEAGIFNKHKPDIGQFDVGDRAFDVGTGTDATKLAHIDRRGGNATGYQQATSDNNANATGSEANIESGTYAGGALKTVAADHSSGQITVSNQGKAIVLNHNEVDDVLTTSAEKVKASALGFTMGPITQSMLCRTTFDPVNKATADTLQITWSVQLQDA